MTSVGYTDLCESMNHINCDISPRGQHFFTAFSKVPTPYFFSQPSLYYTSATLELLLRSRVSRGPTVKDSNRFCSKA